MSSIYINPLQKSIINLPPRNPKVRSFHQSLPHYKPTTLVSLPSIAKELGIAHLLVKDESSRLGLSAFKILGASWATAKAVARHVGLDDELSMEHLASAAQKADLTLYAATDGNHGRAVGRMAKYLGIKATILVPSLVDEEAKSKITGEGAEVEVVDGDYDETVVATKLAAEKHEDGKGLLISDTALAPEDEIPKWIVDGYQTMFDEIEEQLLDITGDKKIDYVVTPVGAGSLAAATVTHFQRTPRTVKPAIVTVEPYSAACMKASLQAGKMASVSATYTICTGMCCGTLSVVVFPILKEGIKVAMTVSDVEVEEAIQLLQGYGVYAGPCGAASLAAVRKLLLNRPGELVLAPDAVAVILCTEGKRGYEMRS